MINTLCSRTTLWIALIIMFSLLLSTDNGWSKSQKVQVPSQMPVGHPVTQAVDFFCKTVNEKSGGELKLSHFPSGQLLTDKEVPKAISKGTVKLAQTYLPWWSGMVKNLFIFGGNQVESFEHQERLITGPLGNYWASLLENKAKSKIIAPLLYSTQSGYITTNRVEKPGDMKGMKIRIPSKVLSAEVTALGGTPTVLSSADVYMGLQRGTIQGAISGLGSFYSRKWYEAAKHVLLIRPMPSYFHIVANLEWFNGLTEKQQKIILEAGDLAAKKCAEMVLELERQLQAKLQKEGVDIVEISRDEYQKNFAPLIEPALRASAVKEFGQELSDTWDLWVEQTRHL